MRPPLDVNDELDLQWPGIGRAWQLAARAATLRCPYCGRGPVRRHWLAMRERCGACDRPLQRGERDYFIGSMMFNLVLSEGLFVVVLVAALALLPPPVPWDALEILVPAGMVVAPVLMFPFARLVWLAFDLMFRPDREGVGPA
jgi:uncharacterized protein (DUF983 family)